MCVNRWPSCWVNFAFLGRLEGQHKNHLVVYCPAVKSGNAQAVAQEYVDIRLDVPVDIDRGKLQFYGSDFLYLKLPFANMSSSGKFDMLS